MRPLEPYFEPAMNGRRRITRDRAAAHGLRRGRFDRQEGRHVAVTADDRNVANWRQPLRRLGTAEAQAPVYVNHRVLAQGNEDTRSPHQAGREIRRDKAPPSGPARGDKRRATCCTGDDLPKTRYLSRAITSRGRLERDMDEELGTQATQRFSEPVVTYRVRTSRGIGTADHHLIFGLAHDDESVESRSRPHGLAAGVVIRSRRELGTIDETACAAGAQQPGEGRS